VVRVSAFCAILVIGQARHQKSPLILFYYSIKKIIRIWRILKILLLFCFLNVETEFKFSIEFILALSDTNSGIGALLATLMALYHCIKPVLLHK
jgi:hypothetical protein